MKRAIISVLLLSACVQPSPPVVPEGSRDIEPASGPSKSSVYWREDEKKATPATAPAAPVEKIPDWAAEVAGLPAGNPLKLLKQKTLPNGLRVYAVPFRELPLFSAALVIPAGAVSDTKERAGLAALVADLLTKGANGKDAQAIATAVESLGADLSAGARSESTSLWTNGLARDADVLLGLLADVTYKPTFAQEEFERAKSFREASIIESLDDETQIASDALLGAYFGAHPYGLPPAGIPEALRSLTLEDVKKFHATRYVPKGSSLVVVGDLDTEEVIALAEKHFGDWKGEAKAGKEEIPVFAAHPSAKRVVIIDKPDVTQVQIRIAWKGVEASHSDEEPIDLVNVTLGGGFTSHLVDEIRVNAGLSYGARSGMSSWKKGGYFVASTFTKKETVREAVDLALKVISDYRAVGPTEVEFKGAKAYLTGLFPLSIETTGGLAVAISEAIFLGQGPSRISGYVEKIKGVSPEKARSTLDTYIPDGKSPYTLILVGPAEEMKKAASGLGEIIVVPLGKHYGGI